MKFKFGKKEKKRDPRTLAIKALLTDQMPPIPTVFRAPFDIYSLPFQMYGNDSVGDCAFAKAGNLEIFWGHIKKGDAFEAASTDQILKAYSAVTGYNPNDPSTDQGTIMIDMLNWWRHHGINNHYLASFGEIQPQNMNLLETSIYLFQGADLGIQIPEHTMEDIEAGKKIFDVPSRHSPIIGGHDVPVIEFDEANYYVPSWGEVYTMTKEFYYTYCDEAYALIGHEYMVKDKTILNGVDIKSLQSYLNDLK